MAVLFKTRRLSSWLASKFGPGGIVLPFGGLPELPKQVKKAPTRGFDANVT